MELTQRKLSAKEWESLEVPILGRELRILKMIRDGFDDVNIHYNDTQTVINFIKLDPSRKKDFDLYIYIKYFKDAIDSLKIDKKSNDKYKKLPTLKKADLIRIKNMESKLANIKTNIFEYIILDLLKEFIAAKGDAKNKYYYTLIRLFRFNISNINSILEEKVKYILGEFANSVNKNIFVKHAYDYIERNDVLSQYKDIRLFPHQKKLFTFCKQPDPKLILYQAPTGTGKTLSPIGLSRKHRIIFVCAAKHVGLQLAKACISLDIKIAVAFGCKDPGNIRLHWNAAKETVRNRKSGGIFKVDNSIGDNVEIMISDVQSYLPAMHYMSAFNKLEDMILFWDEPTITLDYKEHAYHDILSQNWRENEIPNIVLSSATLPPIEELDEMASSFMEKFDSTDITTITSYDCTKTIPIIDGGGKVVLPHLICKTYEELRECLNHIKNCKTLLRHFDIREITRFIQYINEHVELRERYRIDNYFESIESIDIISIKKYYLLLLGAIKDDYETIYSELNSTLKPLYESSIRITTNDAHTLTDGPTIYLANDVEKVGKYCLKMAKIPSVMINAIMEDINCNEKLRIEIEKITKELNKNKDKERDDGGDKVKEVHESENKLDQSLEKCEFLRSQIRRIQLGLKFIPNHKDHLEEWGKQHIKNAFTSDIDDTIVEKIMLLEVSSYWKILLLMGIGVFSLDNDDDYVAIMKELATNQRLYLIIASTDYIYGTNYQFCHGFMGKDLKDMSQEKFIQALGRVGRSDNKKDYSIRLRSDDIISTIFTKSEEKIEVENMNALFS